MAYWLPAMKHLTVLSASALLGFTACETMNKPLNGGDFDPLMPPGGAARLTSNQTGFRGGDLVRSVMDNTAFYKQLPKGEADADKLLLRGTGMKVIRAANSYLQVELDVTGEVGYVPSVMVESATGPVGGTQPLGGQYQVYPPLPGGALPPVDPAGLPPDGAIPSVIDPSLPNTPTPVPGTVPAPGVPTQPGVAPTPPPAPPAPPVPPTPAATETPAPVPPIQPKEETPAKPELEKPAEAAPEKPAGTP